MRTERVGHTHRAREQHLIVYQYLVSEILLNFGFLEGNKEKKYLSILANATILDADANSSMSFKLKGSSAPNVSASFIAETTAVYQHFKSPLLNSPKILCRSL